MLSVAQSMEGQLSSIGSYLYIFYAAIKSHKSFKSSNKWFEFCTNVIYQRFVFTKREAIDHNTDIGNNKSYLEGSYKKPAVETTGLSEYLFMRKI